MGDSPASTVVTTDQATSMEAASTHTVMKHTVTSMEASHMKTSQESAVRLESLVEGGVVEGADQSHQSMQIGSQSHTAQTISQTQSIQSSSQSQFTESSSQTQSIQNLSQSQSTQSISQSQATQSINQSQVSEADIQPAAIMAQPDPEAQVVDENANIQQQQQQAEEEGKAAPQPHHEVPPQTVVEPEPIEEPTPIVESTPVVETAPVAEPDPVVESTPVVEPELAPVVEPNQATEPEPVVEPEPVESAPVVEPEPVAPKTVVEPETVVEKEQIVEHDVEPVATEAPEVVVEPEPAAPETSAVEPEQGSGVHETSGAEISQENIRTQLHEIISEIEHEVLPEQLQPQEEVQGQEQEQGGTGKEQPVVEVKEGETLEEGQYYDEDGVLRHTWQPRGNYEVKSTPITYEEVVPISVPDVTFSEKEVPEPAPPPPQPEPEPQPKVAVNVDLAASMTNGRLSPSQLSPLDIPEGIPLLARILPKDDTREDGGKISLERLFTPATDSGDLTPKKKKAYASSSFYRPDHPTIDDQVELAQRISFSLVDDNNKMSRGQSMYMKRKKRSMRWIHQGGEGEDECTGSGSGTEGLDEGSPPQAPAKPPMKLLMNPKGVQDFQAVQQHYQTLMDSAVPTSPEVNKIVTEVQSPTGKGAELFAKRKKRMDKFIVDETTVQKAQQQTTTVTQQSLSSSTSSSNTFTTKKQAEMERNKQQDQIMLANTVCERADSKAASQAWLEMPQAVPVEAPPIFPAPSGPADFYTAEVKVVQRASLPPTPVVEMPHHSILDFAVDEKDDKRRSSSFNLAAKGWGTYNKFYTPVTFAT